MYCLCFWPFKKMSSSSEHCYVPELIYGGSHLKLILTLFYCKTKLLETIVCTFLISTRLFSFLKGNYHCSNVMQIFKQNSGKTRAGKTTLTA